MRKLPAALALAVFAAGLATPASATFHLMKVVEVFRGTAASPNAQYVVLQMYSPGQNLVGGVGAVVVHHQQVPRGPGRGNGGQPLQCLPEQRGPVPRTNRNR